MIENGNNLDMGRTGSKSCMAQNYSQNANKMGTNSTQKLNRNMIESGNNFSSSNVGIGGKIQAATNAPITATTSKPTKFSQFAISVLTNYFAIDNKPSPQKLTVIAEQTGLTRHQVRVWFQNKRARKDKQRKTQ